jgi:recombination protein RecT
MSTTALKNAAAAGTAVTTEKKGLPALLQQMKPQLALALPRHMNADRVLRIALTELRKTPALMECDSQSVLASVVIASQLGLEPGINGQGYLIPYKGTCTFVPGWKGLVDLAQRSGRSSVWTGAVFDGDEFDYEYGSKPYITHRPGPFHGDPTRLMHVYAVGRVRGAEYPVLEVWSMRKVLEHRDRFNKVGARHYSFQHPEMYGRKVALLQVLKYMPQSIELATAIDLESAAEAGKQKLDMKDAIEGTFVAPSGTGGDAPVEPIGKDEAIAQLKAAATTEALADVWQTIANSYGGEEIPVEIEAVRNDRRDALQQAADKGAGK